MKTFGLFLLLLLGSLVAIDRGLGWLLDQVYSWILVGQKGGRINTYLALLAPPPVLLMGNSRVGCNINPDSLQVGAYSLAHDGTRQIFQNGLLSLLAQKGKLPPTILLHVDLEEFVNPDHLDDIYHLRPFYGQAPLVTAYHHDLSWTERLKFTSSLYRYNGLLFSFVKNGRLQLQQPATENQGYEPLPPTTSDSLKTLYTAHQMQRQAGTLNRGQLRYLQEFIALCRRHQVQLLCFTSPYYRSPHWLPAAATLVDSLLHQQQIPYINLTKAPLPALASLRYWYDETHVNSRGIPLLSQALAHRLHTLPAAAGVNSVARIQETAPPALQKPAGPRPASPKQEAASGAPAF